MGRRRSLTTAAAMLAAALVLPAAAQAATYTVTPNNGPCKAPEDLVCSDLAQAAVAAGDGDTFKVTKGSYKAVEFTKSGLTIAGEGGVGIDGTMKFSGAGGGASKLSGVALSQATASAPALIVSGAAGLELSDSVVLSKDGHAIILSAGTANKIVRSVVITGGATTNAVRIESPQGSAEKGLTIESTILTGGGAGLWIRTESNLLERPAGDVNVVARHLTAAGSSNGIVIDSSNAAGAGVGDIVVTLSDSIALANSKRNYSLLGSENKGDINADVQSITSGDPATLFAAPSSKNFRLRPDSPAIDKGGVTAGESVTDIDGDARPGPTTDLGADEFFNAPPIAVIKVATAKPRNLQPVTFDGRASGDRESFYGGGIVKYQWSFGDGETAETATPTVQHTYASEGTATVGLVVVDNFGAVSAAATTPVTLLDGVPPDVKITKPLRDQKLKLSTVTKKTVTDDAGKKTTTSTKRKLKLAFAGTATDKSGVANVVLFIEKLSATKKKTATTAKPSAAKPPAAASKCTWLDPRKGLIKRSCKNPVFIVARLAKDGSWTYNVSSKIKQPSAGSYRVIATGVDGTGAAGNSGTPADAVIKFTLSK